MENAGGGEVVAEGIRSGELLGENGGAATY